eukprot:COSAG01_NODE_2450_length_7674_cov_86.009109_3_plen_336_part_00
MDAATPWWQSWISAPAPAPAPACAPAPVAPPPSPTASPVHAVGTSSDSDSELEVSSGGEDADEVVAARGRVQLAKRQTALAAQTWAGPFAPGASRYDKGLAAAVGECPRQVQDRLTWPGPVSSEWSDVAAVVKSAAHLPGPWPSGADCRLRWKELHPEAFAQRRYTVPAVSPDHVLDAAAKAVPQMVLLSQPRAGMEEVLRAARADGGVRGALASLVTEDAECYTAVLNAVALIGHGVNGLTEAKWEAVREFEAAVEWRTKWAALRTTWLSMRVGTERDRRRVLGLIRTAVRDAVTSLLLEQERMIQLAVRDGEESATAVARLMQDNSPTSAGRW